jgi:hypothetical protein
MGWAVTVEGRIDPGAIVLLIEEREEAESIAREIRSRGTQVVVRPYPSDRAAGGRYDPAGAGTGSDTNRRGPARTGGAQEGLARSG